MSDARDVERLERCLCTIHSQHPATTFVYVVGAASASHDDAMRNTVGRHENTSLLRCQHPVRSFDALGLTAELAARHGASHFAFLQHHMRVLQPFPLASLECPLMSFQVRLSAPRLAATPVGRHSPPQNLSLIGPNSSEGVEHIPQLGFVCNGEALHRLLSSRLFSDAHACGGDEERAERHLATAARHRLASPPLRCSLDGCTPSGLWTAHADETACHAVRALQGIKLRPVDAPALPPPSVARCRPTANGNGAEAGMATTPLLRHVAPPSRIAHQLFAGLTPGPSGTALFGADAMRRLAAEPQEARRVLIVVHSHRPTPFDAVHSRMLGLPRTRDLWVVRDAAVLLLCNNRNQSTTSLLSRLGRYPQRSRWLIHSPVNAGMRHERSPGYLCGEMGSLVGAAPVWSQYTWVLYSNPDVVVTPELFARLSTKLLEGSFDIMLDRFPGGAHRKIRYAMEYVAFRVRSMLGGSPPLPALAFDEALRLCLTERGIFPEDILYRLVQSYGLRVAPLGAVQYLTFNKAYNNAVRAGKKRAGAKTFLYAGGIWHNEDFEQVDAYLKEEEANSSAVTPRVPTAEQLTKAPFA